MPEMKHSISHPPLTFYPLLSVLSVATLLLSIIYFDAYRYDVLAYHAPFTALATKISSLRDFELEEFLYNRFLGFPPTWRYALYPGLILNSPRLLILPNLVALMILVYACKSIIKLSVPLSIASVISYPIILYAFRSAYQDFFVGALVTASLFFTLSLVVNFRRSCWFWTTATLILASTTKYQGLIQALAVIGIGYLFLLTRFLSAVFRYQPKHHSLKGMLFLTVSLLLVLIHPTLNWLIHSNPFFPVEVAGFDGPEFNYTEAQTYTQLFWPLHSFFNHISSATELDWLFRGVVPNYSIDQHASQAQYGGILDPISIKSLIRSGGTFSPFYFSIALPYVFIVFGEWRKLFTLRSMPAFRQLVCGASIFSILVAFMPQSHELRYYLSSLMVPSIITTRAIFLIPVIRSYLAFMLSIFFVFAMTVNFIQPIKTTLEGYLSTGRLGYLYQYPSRDLPTRDYCLSHGSVSADQKTGFLKLNTGTAFACRIVLRGEENFYIYNIK